MTERGFINHPNEEKDTGKISPRIYVTYDSTTPPDPKYFRSSVINSFEDPKERVNFLNKFFQCLMCGRMPQKVKKLVVMRPKDCGKTTWASVFLSIIRKKFIASIIQENQFSCALIDEDTQIIFLDEWAERTLQSDMTKLVLQRGYMVSAVKHGKPKILDNRCPFYITTNKVPHFGNDEENVQRRIRVFKTKSAESCLTNVDRWIMDNPMDCIVWITQEIEENIELVDVDERWYEGNPHVGNDVAVTERGIFTGIDLANAAESVIFDIEKVKSISKEEILPVFKIDNKIKTPQDPLHDSFRDAAESALEKGRNKKEEEAISEKELGP